MRCAELGSNGVCFFVQDRSLMIKLSHFKSRNRAEGLLEIMPLLGGESVQCGGELAWGDG